jgi:hypothetical protein
MEGAFMKRLTLLAAAFLAVACNHPFKPKTQGQPVTMDQRILGYWELTSALSDADAKESPPTRLKFSVNKGLKQVEFCSADLNSARGFSVVNGKVMSEGGIGGLKDPVVTKLDGNALELNKKYAYKRFNPGKELSATDADASLCKK